MISELHKYDVVVVHFNSTNATSREYNYKMHASMKPAVGDVVIVESPFAGLVTCTVQRVLSKNAPSYEVSRATKWVVDKVNREFYDGILCAEKQAEAARIEAYAQTQRIAKVENLMESLPRNSKARKYLKQALAAL